jgi:hypothetical protein
VNCIKVSAGAASAPDKRTGRKREGAKGIFGRTKSECAGTVSLNHPLTANLREQENYA